MRYNILIPITRKWCIKDFFKSVNEMCIPQGYTEFILYVDSNDKDLISEVYFFSKLLKMNKYESKVVLSGKEQPGEFGNVHKRRARIIEMREACKEHLTADYLFSLEDDTIAPKDAFKKLSRIMETNNNVGFATGAEVQRWGMYSVGAYVFENPEKVVSLMPKKGIELIDMAGMYCYMTKTELYKKHKFTEDSMLGPDMLFAWDIVKQGKDAYIDWSVRCKHLTKKETIGFDKVGQLSIDKKDKEWILTYDLESEKIS